MSRSVFLAAALAYLYVSMTVFAMTAMMVRPDCTHGQRVVLAGRAALLWPFFVPALPFAHLAEHREPGTECS